MKAAPALRDLVLLLPLASVFWGQANPSVPPVCQPCQLKIAPGGPSFSFTLQPAVTSDKQKTDRELSVARNGIEVQRLALHHGDATLQGPGAFAGIDINFDGFQDVQFITRRGVANAYADYWIYKPSTTRFVYLGNYPILVPNPANHSLRSYERNGEAGLAYASKEYRFAGDKLLLMRSEVEEETSRYGVFQLTIQQRIDGSLKVTSRKLVKPSGIPR